MIQWDCVVSLCDLIVIVDDICLNLIGSMEIHGI